MQIQETMCKKFKVKSGEMVVPRDVADNMALRHALMDMLDELDASQIEITEQELTQRVDELFQRFGGVAPTAAKEIHQKFERLNKLTRPMFCKQCGAPLRGSVCEYCGTEY